MTCFARSMIGRGSFGSPAAASSRRPLASTSRGSRLRAKRQKPGTARSRKLDSRGTRLLPSRFADAARRSWPERDGAAPGDPPGPDLVGRSRGTPRVGARVPASCARRSARRGQPESPRHRCHLCPYEQYGSRARPGKHAPSEAVDGAAAGFRRQRFTDRNRRPRRPRGPRRHVAPCLDRSGRRGTTVVPGTRSAMSFLEPGSAGVG